MSSESKQDIPQDELPVNTTGYKPPEQVSVAELMAKDSGDESLAKYKASLLAKADAVPCTLKLKFLLLINFLFF
jgi:hypothetical protein